MTLKDCDPKTASLEDIILWATRPIKLYADQVQRTFEERERIEDQSAEVRTAYYMLASIQDFAQQIEDFLHARVKAEFESKRAME